jgi:hypothetical protein
MCAVSTRAHSEAMAHTTSPKSVSSVALAVSTLLSALSLSAFGAPSAHAETFAHEKQTCTSGVCLVAVKIMVDTDGDGVSDDDEIAAGTNPNDPFNRPSPKDLVGLAAEGKLPSFNDHVTEVLVMPTQGPDGQSLGNGYLPARENLMKLFGIGGDMLKSSGLDPNGGVRITADRDAMFNIGGKNISSGHAPVRVGGLDFALVSAGDSRLFGQGPNGTKAHSKSDTTTGSGDVKTTTRRYDDGSKDVQQRASSTGVTNQQSTGSSGNASGSGSASTKTDIAGFTTRTTVTKDSLGSITTTDTSKKNSDGSGVSETHEKRVYNDGSGWTKTTTSKTSKNADGSTATVVTVKETSTSCSGGSCTTAVTRDDEAEYSNPDADYTTIWISDAQYARIVGKFNDNKTPGPVKEGPLDGDSGVTVVAGAGFDPLVALVDDAEDAAVTAYLAPFVKNVLVVNYDGGASPDKDPRLPDLLGSITAGAGGRCGGCNS